jgi:AAHS family 4-hydroxybenzoate transporter-like MFS transporter
MGDDPAVTEAARVDIGKSLDDGPFTFFQIFVVVLAAVAIVLDGLSNQLIGFAIPSIAHEWGVKPGAIAPAVATGIFGMGVGSVFVGPFADRFGRRWAMILCVLVYGVFTCLVYFASGVLSLGALRFIAALGAGGAVPVSTTVTAEFTPRRRRTLAVTAGVVCFPLGGMVAGLFARPFLPSHGWRALFLESGMVPLVLLVLLLVALPESPRFLARHPKRWPELERLLKRMARPVEPHSEFCDAAEQAHGQGFAVLFTAQYRRDTLALFGAFSMCLLSVYNAFSWLPTMLVSAGLPGTSASSGLTVYNMGGVLGAVVCAIVIARVGSRVPMLVCCVGASLSVVLLTQLHMQNHTTMLLVGLAAHGFFVNAVQAPMFALAAYVYPTSIRATGTSSAVAVGRLGAVLSAFTGAAVIAAGGSSGYLLMLAGLMVLVFIALASVRNHIPAHGS